MLDARRRSRSTAKPCGDACEPFLFEARRDAHTGGLIRGSLVAALAAMAMAFAHAETQTDPVEWLKKIASAARELNYAGTFVYQYGSQVETSRIIHSSDESGDYAKLEALDGPPREIIRSNEEIRCYLPESKTV